MKFENIERVFVLGAGVSKHCGYPLTNELINEIITKHFDYEEEKEDTYHIYDFIMNLYPNLNSNYKMYPNIEEVLSLIEISDDIGTEIPKFRYDWYMQGISEIERSISKKINGTEIPKFRSDSHIRDVSGIKRAILKRIYWYFFKMLEEVNEKKAIFEFAKCLKPNDVIISFNWDLNLEKVLVGLKKEYQYYLIEDNNNEKITILKPHGSMNWFKRNEIHLKEDRAKPLFEGSKEIEVDVFNHLRRPETIQGNEIPLIIPPIMQKKINEDLKKIWENIFDAVSNTNKINVLGYSLPSNDLNIQYVLRWAVWKNKHFNDYNRKKSNFLVVNPDESVYLRYRKLVRDPIQFEQAKFEELNFEQLFNS